MTTATKVKPINTEAIKFAEECGKTWLKAKAAKAAAEAEMKEWAAQLEMFAKNNRAAFGTTGTLKVGPVKLKFANQGKIKTDENFDPIGFATFYPELVNISPSVAYIKGYLIDNEVKESLEGAGVFYIQEEKFSVEKA